MTLGGDTGRSGCLQLRAHLKIIAFAVRKPKCPLPPLWELLADLKPQLKPGEYFLTHLCPGAAHGPQSPLGNWATFRVNAVPAPGMA